MEWRSNYEESLNIQQHRCTYRIFCIALCNISPNKNRKLIHFLDTSRMLVFLWQRTLSENNILTIFYHTIPNVCLPLISHLCFVYICYFLKYSLSCVFVIGLCVSPNTVYMFKPFISLDIVICTPHWYKYIHYYINNSYYFPNSINITFLLSAIYSGFIISKAT